MHNLFIDEGVLNDYKTVICEEAGLSPSKVEPSFYSYILRHCSKSLPVPVSGETFKPIRFLVSIRTNHTNELIVPRDGKFYTDCTSDYPDEHPLDDMSILAMKKLVDERFDCGEHTPEIISHTMPHVVGALIHNDIPYVYADVVIDSKLKDNEHFKLRDCEFVPIQSIKPNDGLEESLLNSLAITKGGHENAHDDH